MFADCELETKGFITVHVLRMNLLLVMPLSNCSVALLENVDGMETAEFKQQTVAVALMMFLDTFFCLFVSPPLALAKLC